MSFEIINNIYWVGKTDWEIRNFHGKEYSTHKGTTYNSYLIKDEKTVLIDTVWTPYAKEFITNLKKHIDLEQIDYIIINHAEPDHSGALPELMKEIPNTPIYCSENALKSIKGYYKEEWNFVPVKTGDRLNIGVRELLFIEARMLHWPDSMFCYLTNDNILFSNDAFGQHYCSEHLYNDQVDQFELFQEAIKYYANIINPSNKLVQKKVDEILKLEIPIEMICTSHGVIWRDNPFDIVHKYVEWSKDYQENQISIIYDTMYNSTKFMAEAIAKGIKDIDNEVTVKLLNTSVSDRTDIITEVFKSKAIAVGSSTINSGILSSVNAFLDEIKGLKFKNKKGLAFGSYGWSGESVKIISEMLEMAGFNLLEKGYRVLWRPDKESISSCEKLGNKIANSIKNIN
ncbi:anaerobic nitric oxide reductase flavorubredoxin [Mycoplasmatota bacterium]|nr:anaerobic nitric oxide reductase flavorubredoxin [Mycoplasmatota bacterium]